MRILFLSQWFPFPADNGSKIRIDNLLRGLAQYHQVTLVSFTDREINKIDCAGMEPVCQEIHTVLWRPFNPNSWNAFRGYLSPTPRSVVDTASPEMERLIRALVASNNFDLVVASELEMAGYARAFQGIPAILDQVQLGVLYEQYAGEKVPLRRLRSALTWQKQRSYVERLLKQFRGCTVVSQPELKLFSQAFPDYGAVRLIPNSIDLQRYAQVREEPDPTSLVFTGSFQYSPNYEAMQWFLTEVFPLVKQAVPHVRLTITGDSAGKPLPLLDGVTLLGRVDDIRPIVASAWISLAPIWTGGGTRLKILEAMALKTPVVATSKGAEGIDVTHGKNILLANTSTEYSQAIIRLLTNPGLRAELVSHAYRLVSEKYNWTTVLSDFLDLVESSVPSSILSSSAVP